jgi:hypothetical protein
VKPRQRFQLTLRVTYLLCGGLCFTATRSLGEDPQRIRRFSAATLLELVNPIGHGSDHITRRFTSSVCLNLGCRPGLLTLFDDSDCFLLRHCCFFELPVGIYSYRTNLPSRSSQINWLERWTAIKLAKKRPHPVTRRTPAKRATSREKFFESRLKRDFSPANRTPTAEHIGT